MNAGSWGNPTLHYDMVASGQMSCQRFGTVSTTVFKVYLQISTAKNYTTDFYLGLVGYQEMIFTFQRNSSKFSIPISSE